MNEPETDMEKYIHHLKYHDWWFEWSDDHRVWLAGKDSLSSLLEKAAKLDPDWKIWNEHAPKECSHVRPAENNRLQTM